ncbi:MAG TPA: DUF222 domain-containing protein, partial [Actinomycetota bacterium]|nr:DUF222 domain-containing protein [Actinomycetota bacterium]
MITARLRPETTVDALDDGVRRLTAASAEVLEMVADADERGLWRRDGATSMTPWLAARYGLAWSTAREWVRVAHALRRLPAIAEAYASSRISWDQVRPVTQFATAESDEFWAGRAGHLRPKTLHREAERHRAVHPVDAQHLRRARHLSLEWNRQTTMLHLRGALPPEEGAAVETVLLRRSEAITVPRGEEPPSADARRADALVELVTARPGGEAATPTLVVHAGAEVLTGEAPPEGPWLAETEGGQRLATEQ